MAHAVYETTLPRAAAALFVGQLTGGSLVTAWVLGEALYAAASQPGDLALGVASLFLTGAAVTGTFGLGLALLAAPLWYVLHRLGWRGPLAAAVLGWVLTFCTVAGPRTLWSLIVNAGDKFTIGDNGGAEMIEGVLTRHGWSNILGSAAEIGVAGAIVGLVVWRVAYRRRDAARPST